MRVRSMRAGVVNVMLQELRDHVQRSTIGNTPSGIDNATFSVAVALMEIAVIVSASILSGIIYHIAAYNEIGQVTGFAVSGLITAICFIVPFAFRSEYRVENFLSAGRGVPRILEAWIYAILTVTLIGFLTKSSGDASRGWLLIFSALGLAAVVIFNIILHRWIAWGVETAWIAPRRLMVIGDPEGLARFTKALSGRRQGIEIVVASCLPPREVVDRMTPDEISLRVEEAAERGRDEKVSDVVVLVDPARDALLRHVTDGLMDLPVTIHLAGWSAIESFPGLKTEHIGHITTLTLVRAPMGAFQSTLKRTVDIILAAVGLLLISPVLVLAAIAIKLDSPGPVFFRQHRRGFNQHEFLIWKLRTMVTMDDGDNIVQASKNDPRVTNVGRFLRRTNIDELPQLINVLLGEMSLVGPRPHAVAHDRRYERCIDRYARRLNVKPGITGWAQVNGFRGPTNTDQAMRERLAHDLYYIDNWSIAFDLLILLMTVVSPRAYKNAL